MWLYSSRVEYFFADYIEKGIQESGYSRCQYLSMLKEKYDGYRFNYRSETVYNPISIGFFFSDGGVEFDDYWIDTGGNMKLLMDIAKRVDFGVIKDISEPIAKTELKTFDITSLINNTTEKVLKSLLLQTGYLTISKAEDSGNLLYLKFPNLEVIQGFGLSLLTSYYSDNANFKESKSKLRMAFEAGQVGVAIGILQAIFESIPYNLRGKDGKRQENVSKQNEAYYHSILYVMLLALGADVTVEVPTRKGRIDALLQCPEHVYVIELKVDKSAQEALVQIYVQQHAKKYEYDSQGKTIHKLGINFNTVEGNIDQYVDQIVEQ